MRHVTTRLDVVVPLDPRRAPLDLGRAARALQPQVDLEVLADGELVPEAVELRAEPRVREDLGELRAHRAAAQPRVARARPRLAREDADRRRLARAVGPEQCEAAARDADRERVDRDELRVLRAALLPDLVEPPQREPVAAVALAVRVGPGVRLDARALGGDVGVLVGRHRQLQLSGSFRDRLQLMMRHVVTHLVGRRRAPGAGRRRGRERRDEEPEVNIVEETAVHGDTEERGERAEQRPRLRRRVGDARLRLREREAEVVARARPGRVRAAAGRVVVVGLGEPREGGAHRDPQDALQPSDELVDGREEHEVPDQGAQCRVVDRARDRGRHHRREDARADVEAARLLLGREEEREAEREEKDRRRRADQHERERGQRGRPHAAARGRGDEEREQQRRAQELAPRRELFRALSFGTAQPTSEL